MAYGELDYAYQDLRGLLSAKSHDVGVSLLGSIPPIAAFASP